MKTLLALAATALAAGQLAGCAATPRTTEVDNAYVNYVENAARRYGTTVIWLNYPRRPVQPAAEAPAQK